MFKCPVCEAEFNKLISLSLHFRRTHKATAKDLVVAMNFNGVEPTCKCGCGSAVKFLDISRGFTDYVRGHASRIHNNWGHNEKAISNGQKTRKTMLEQGAWKPFVSKDTGEHWGKGLTKETDSRINKMSKSILDNPKEIETRSQRMRKNRENGLIPTLRKEKHSQWSGGISPLNTYCRASVLLYKNWKYPRLVASGFQCSSCRKDGPGLEVHHDKEAMSEIVRRFAAEFGWDSWFSSNTSKNDQYLIELKEKISIAVADYHINNNVSGVVLCEACHRKEHRQN
jgi:hypothetical protein